MLQLALIDFWKTYQHILKTTASSVFHLYWPPSSNVVYKNVLLSSSHHCLTSCLITLSSSDSLLVFHRYFRVKFPQYPSQCIIWSQQGAISNKSCPQIDPNSNFWVSESMRVNNLLSLWIVSYLIISLFAIFILKKRRVTHHKQTLKCSFYIILDGPTGKTPWSPKLAAENFTLQW